MTPKAEEWFRSVVIAALCLGFAALLWTVGGAVFEQPVLDNAHNTEN
jgi:hypothetical protein